MTYLLFVLSFLNIFNYAILFWLIAFQTFIAVIVRNLIVTI